ncbi:MAG: toll/interleukin-1 receptor domain-containing protein, partial [Bacteroidota bacterium]
MQERLKYIDEQVQKNYQLLAEWEKKEMYADNPTERMQSQEEITLIKERIEAFLKEKKELLTPQREQNVIISCDSKSPDLDLARDLRNQLEAYGHHVFLAESRLKGEENWYDRMLDELTKSDYFVLLLSERSLVSEMVTEEVKRVRELRLGRPSKKPLLLTVRVNLRLDEYFNFNLAGYLENVYESDWIQPEDSPAIIQDVSFLINNNIQEIKKSARLPSNPDVDYAEFPSPNAPLELPSGSVALDS